jgi:hypothetical protein
MSLSKPFVTNHNLTVTGNISASNLFYDVSGNSSQWNSAYNNQTKYLPLSGGTITGALTVQANITFPTGCIAYWNLNNNGSGGVSLVDSTGNGYTLTNNGGVTLGSGIIDGAAVFTSAGGTSLTNSSLSTSGAWSISWWVKVTSSNISTAYPSAFFLGDINGTFITAVLGNGNPTSGWIYSSREDRNYGQFYNTSLNTWYNYVLTNDPTNGLNWYINGSLYVGGGGGINRDFTGITLGQGNTTGETDCIIDEVGVWNRALSSQEVAKLYNGGAGLTYQNVTIGIGTSTPNKELTVVGNVSATKNFYDSVGNSNQWNTAYVTSTAYSSVSSTFATNTLLQSTSALLTPLTTTNTLTSLLTPLTVTNTLTGLLVKTTDLNTLSGTLLTRTDYSTSSANFFKQNGNAFGGQAIIGTTDNNNFSVYTNNSEKMRIFTNGNVAYDDFDNMPGAAGNSTYKVMHYASPTNGGSTMLSMASKYYHTVFFGNLGGNGFVIGSEGTSHGIAFKQGLTYGASDTLGTGTTVMFIGGNGNTGIGTNLTSPNERLTVSGNVSATGTIFASDGNSNNWNTAYQSVSSQPLTLVNATNSIKPVRGSNTASGNYSNVAGGGSNNASGNYSNVAGGGGNTASGYQSNVAGGGGNNASGCYSNVTGGIYNTASGNHSNVAGGQNNNASNHYSNVAGGYGNNASGFRSTVAGGIYNTASEYVSNVAGGVVNTASGVVSNVAGGSYNNASGHSSNVAGGNGNTASGYISNVAGGNGNIACGYYSNVAGGCCNTASGYNSNVAGGVNNNASGDCSGILGGQCNNTNSQCNSFIIGSNITATQPNTTYVNNLYTAGNIIGATKSFLIDHPTKEGKKLQYGSLESPYHGIRLTGKAKLTGKETIVKLPDYIKDLVHEEDVNVQITNINHSKVLYIKSIDIKNNKFTIGVDKKLTEVFASYEFFWSFTAVRKDVPDLIVEV